MRTQFNCCKTYNCFNLANPDLSLYQRSSQLGFASYKCPLCGAFTPILENEPILALAKQIETNQLHLADIECPTCLKHTETSAYGSTRIGTPRVKCNQCSTVFSLLNPHKTSSTLQPLLTLLTSGVLPKDLQRLSQLNSKLFYTRLKQLAQLLQQFNQLLIQKYLSETESSVSLYTSSFTFLSRSGKGNTLKCWNLSTTDSQYGFHVLDTDNFYQHGTQKSPAGLYYLDFVEVTDDSSSSPLTTVQATYDKIFSRSKFDELGYAYQIECQSNEGSVLRPVYAAHAHWISLSKILPEHYQFDFFLEHESFIRGGAITNLTQEIVAGRFNLYYLYTKPSVKNSTTDIEQKSIGWWGENWSTQTKQYPSGYWDVTLCALTENKEPNLEFNGTEWHQDYLNQLTQWLPTQYQKTISYQMSQHWRAIFNYLYNFTYSLDRRQCFTEFEFESILEIVSTLNDSTSK